VPAGAVSLIEAAKCGNDQKKRGVVETIIFESAPIEMLPWMPFAGNALQVETEGTLPNVQFRRVNEGYASSWGSDAMSFWGVAILGGEVKVDKFLTSVVSNEKDVKAKQWAKLAKANAGRFDWEFFNGTGLAADKGFKGLKTLISEGYGQRYQHSGTGAVMNSTTGLRTLDVSLDLFRNQGKPDAGLVNRTVRRQITWAARESVSGVSLIDVGTDVFGRKVNMYDDIPLRIIGDTINPSGAVVPGLGFNEDPGDATADTCSMYWVKFSEDDVCGLLGLGGSFEVKDFGELETQPQQMGRLEWYPGMAVFNQYSVVRVTGITAA